MVSKATEQLDPLGGGSTESNPMPAMSKVLEFSGYESNMSPKECLAQARAKFPVAPTPQDEDAHVRHASASFTVSA